jgi:hypothetical protein
MSLSLEMTETKRDELSLAEQAALERTLSKALFVVVPSDKFVAQLGQHLAEAAKHEAEAEQRRERRLRTAGLVGGLFSVLGGLVVWLLWRKRHGKTPLTPALGHQG